MTEPRLTIADCRKIGFCVDGVRARCRVLDLDFRTFVREGFPISEMEKIDDFQIQRAVEVARARHEEADK